MLQNTLSFGWTPLVSLEGWGSCLLLLTLYTRLCDLAYRKATAQWKNNWNTFIEVEWWGTQNEPRIKLPEGPFVHCCQASKKGMGIHSHGFLCWGKCLVNDVGDGLRHLTDILYDTFMSLHSNFGMWRIGIEAWTETMSWENGDHAVKTGGLDSALASAKRSAMIYRRITITHILV